MAFECRCNMSARTSDSGVAFGTVHRKSMHFQDMLRIWSAMGGGGGGGGGSSSSFFFFLPFLGFPADPGRVVAGAVLGRGGLDMAQ